MQELSILKPEDQAESIDISPEDKGYPFIMTSGHGYLVVKKEDKNASIAKRLCKYGYIGKLAYYLEEDCEAPEFLKSI